MRKICGCLVLWLAGWDGVWACGWAQGNYEIQVYGADTVAPKNTDGGAALELHGRWADADD